jgi:hypothetical protein
VDNAGSETPVKDSNTRTFECSKCTQVTMNPCRCLQCWGWPLLCSTCMIESHRLHPFHSIEKWNQDHFERTTLTAEGYQLCMHSGNTPCPYAPDNVTKDFTIISGSPLGIGSYNVQWCGCPGAEAHWKQLLQWRLLPASSTRPQTAFAFDALDHFLIDNTVCHTTAYSFYDKTRHLTNPLQAVGTVLPVEYFLKSSFLLMIFYCDRIGTVN